MDARQSADRTPPAWDCLRRLKNDV